jgi:hypothetical protein
MMIGIWTITRGSIAAGTAILAGVAISTAPIEVAADRRIPGATL